MSDIAESLLAQYYGISDEQKIKGSLSIQECMSNVMNDMTDRSIDEQSSVDINDNGVSRGTEVQENNIENMERNCKDDIPARSSRVLEWETLEMTLENDHETWPIFDILFEANTEDKLGEDESILSEKNAHCVLNSNKIVSIVPEGPDNNDENDLYLSLSEDALADSASDISSVGKEKSGKKSANTFVTPSTPPSNKIPIYNETFVDLRSVGLTSLSVAMLEKYRTIQMLYLEDNSLSELPKELFIILPHMQWLDVRSNQLTSLPTTIKSHSSLETILLQENKLEKLPLELCLVPKLKTLNVAHNPITVPPKDIIALGCSSILTYLRVEWNKLHPNEPVTIMKQEIEPKASTILCYQSPREKCKKLPKIRQQVSKSTGNISNPFKVTSVRKKSSAYKPSNRCDSKGINIATEQRLYWISNVRDALSAQAATIQKIKNADALKQWRRNKRSFSKSMEKVSRRNEDDIPYAIDIEDYPAIQKRQQKLRTNLDMQKQRKSRFTPPANIHAKIQELLKSLQEIEIAKSSEILTPKSKQNYLQTKIEELSRFQNEVQHLKRYNEMVPPMNSSTNSS